MSAVPPWLAAKFDPLNLSIGALEAAFGPYDTWPDVLRHSAAMLAHSGFPMFLLWGAQRKLLYNVHYVPVLGDKHPVAFGESFAEVWPEIMPTIGPVIDAAFRGHESFFEDLEVQLWRDGRLNRAWFTFSYNPVRDLDGTVVAVSCICVETTKQVLGREAERVAHSRLKEAFEQAPGFICTLRGPDHVFEYVNAAHRRLFGSENWVGKPVREAFADIAGQGFYELLDQVFSSGEPVSIASAPARFRLASESAPEERLLDFTYAPLRDDRGQIIGIFCEGYDVTEHRRGSRRFGRVKLTPDCSSIRQLRRFTPST